jgi:hypothetical protein
VVALRGWLKTHFFGFARPVHNGLGPPICRPSKIVCIGLQLTRPAAEAGAAIPMMSEADTPQFLLTDTLFQ